MLILPMLLGAFQPPKPGNWICCGTHLMVTGISLHALIIIFHAQVFRPRGKTVAHPSVRTSVVQKLRAAWVDQRHQVLRLRAISAVARDKPVRRSAQDDVFVGVLKKNIQSKLVRRGLGARFDRDSVRCAYLLSRLPALPWKATILAPQTNKSIGSAVATQRTYRPPFSFTESPREPTPFVFSPSAEATHKLCGKQKPRGIATTLQLRDQKHGSRTFLGSQRKQSSAAGVQHIEPRRHRCSGACVYIHHIA